MSSLAEEPQLAGVHARVAEAFADVDGERRSYLDVLVKRGGTCRACGAQVQDAFLVEHPGVCATCFRKRGVRPDPSLLAQLAPAQPAAPTESPMPETTPKQTPLHICEKCGGEVRARKGKVQQPCFTCRKGGTTKAPAAAPTSKPAALKPRATRARVVLEALDVQELLERRTQLRDELKALDAALRARAEKLEADRKALLDAVSEAA